MVNKIVLIVITFLAGAIQVSGQQYKAAPLPVERSKLIQQLKAWRLQNPKASPAEFAQAAHELLDRNGLNYAVLLDQATCQRIRDVKGKQKDPSAPVSLGATLKSVDAEGASLALPEPVFSPGDCGCYIELPLLQVTDADFITIVSGRNIRFHFPSNFSTHAAVLLDASDRTKVKRRWRIPFRAMPIGVSHDESVLYLAFEEPELAALSLQVFGEGVFEIGTRAEADEGGKGRALDVVSGHPTRLTRFDRWGKTFLVAYKEPCR